MKEEETNGTDKALEEISTNLKSLNEKVDLMLSGLQLVAGSMNILPDWIKSTNKQLNAIQGTSVSEGPVADNEDEDALQEFHEELWRGARSNPQGSFHGKPP